MSYLSELPWQGLVPAHVMTLAEILNKALSLFSRNVTTALCTTSEIVAIYNSLPSIICRY